MHTNCTCFGGQYDGAGGIGYKVNKFEQLSNDDLQMCVAGG